MVHLPLSLWSTPSTVFICERCFSCASTAGINAFHFGVVGFDAEGKDSYEDSGHPPFDYNVGAVGMPKVMAVLEAIGREIAAARSAAANSAVAVEC